MSAPTPTVEDRPLEQLTEWARNPRRISKPRLEALKRALVAEPEMLQARPLIALPDGTVVAGNQRLRAAAYCDVIRKRYADFTGQPDLAP